MIQHGVQLCLLTLSLFTGAIIHVSGQTNVTEHGHGPCKPGAEGEYSENRISLEMKNSIVNSETECTNGFAGEYPCANTTLKSFLSSKDLNRGVSSVETNDNWGWTSSDGREIALVGLGDGTSFVDITDPVNPIVIGKLPTESWGSWWRDIKTYQNHAFIVSEESGHGMQVFNLTQLQPGLVNEIFSNTARYTEFGSAHNIFINEDSGYAYAVGSRTCGKGLHMIDISTPASPVFAGCYSARGYTHDVQCVNYDGPDPNYVNREVCFASNEDSVDIIDVTDKNTPSLISIFSYSGARYTHQGWLTEDKHYFLIDDELDEYNGVTANSKTFVCDVTDLQNPTLKTTYTATTRAIDHNQYVKGTLLYQANYRAGLRIIDLADIENENLHEIAFFDTYPQDDNNQFTSAWSCYPYFDSGNIIITDFEQGLFVVSMTSTETFAPSASLAPSKLSSGVPSEAPDITRSVVPSLTPSPAPSKLSSGVPSEAPDITRSVVPSLTPSIKPSIKNSIKPSINPSKSPTQTPSWFPSNKPSLSHSTEPSLSPSVKPSLFPNETPSSVPSNRNFIMPSSSPSKKPPQVVVTTEASMSISGIPIPTTEEETETVVATLTNTLSELSGNNIVEITALNGVSVNKSNNKSNNKSSNKSNTRRRTEDAIIDLDIDFIILQEIICESSCAEAMASAMTAASTSTQMLTDSMSNGSFANTFVQMANEQGATALASANITVDPTTFVSQEPQAIIVTSTPTISPTLNSPEDVSSLIMKFLRLLLLLLELLTQQFSKSKR